MLALYCCLVKLDVSMLLQAVLHISTSNSETALRIMDTSCTLPDQRQMILSPKPISNRDS